MHDTLASHPGQGWRDTLRVEAPGLGLCLVAGAWLLAATWPVVVAAAVVAFGLGAVAIDARLTRGAGLVRSTRGSADPATLVGWLLFAIALFALVSASRDPGVVGQLRVGLPAPERALGVFLLLAPLGWLAGQALLRLVHPAVAAGLGFKPSGIRLDDGAMLVQVWRTWRMLPPGEAVDAWRRIDQRWSDGFLLVLGAGAGFDFGIKPALPFDWGALFGLAAMYGVLSWLVWRPVGQWLSGLASFPKPDWRLQGGMGRSGPLGTALAIGSLMIGGMLGGEWLPEQTWAQAVLGLPQRGVELVFNAGGFGLCLGAIVALAREPVRPEPRTEPLTEAMPHG